MTQISASITCGCHSHHTWTRICLSLIALRTVPTRTGFTCRPQGVLCSPLNPPLFCMRRFLRSLSIMTRPPNWKAHAPFPPVGNITYAEQDSLPTLPVPALHGTLQKLKTSLKPLAKTSEEYNAALKKIDAFATGPGPTLQRRLEARAAEPGREHWLEEWWDDLAYMGYRDSVSLLTALWSRTFPLSLCIGCHQRLVLL